MPNRDTELGSTPVAGPNPRRVAAGKLNREKRKGLTADGRERLRQAALRGKPWEHATGPRTTEGKAKAARNGKARQLGPVSVRELRVDLRALRALAADMRDVRLAAGV